MPVARAKTLLRGGRLHFWLSLTAIRHINDAQQASKNASVRNADSWLPDCECCHSFCMIPNPPDAAVLSRRGRICVFPSAGRVLLAPETITARTAAAIPTTFLRFRYS